jgi:hypothetical protein
MLSSSSLKLLSLQYVTIIATCSQVLSLTRLISQLGAYQQGTRARLIQADDDLRALRRERDDALRDLNASKDQTRIWVAEVDKWKSEARPPFFPSSLPLFPCLPSRSRQSDRALIVVGSVARLSFFTSFSFDLAYR